MRHRLIILAWCAVMLFVGGGWYLAQLHQAGTATTRAAIALVKSLDEKQRQQVVLSYDTPQRLGWHFIPKDQRKGLQLRDMSPQQQKLALEVLRAALSQIGADKAQAIMDLENILNHLEGEKARFARDPLRYYWTVFGQPSEDGKWGLSIEGHHLSLNFVFDGNRVVAHTPAFFGANPAVVKGDYPVGPKKGTRVLKKEEVLAFELLKSLDDPQRRKAVLADKAPSEMRAAGEPHPPQTKPEGLAAAELSTEQVEILRSLIGAYLENMPEEVARQRWEEINKADLKNVYFAWAGAQEPGEGHYYRLQGPTFLVEFVNTQPDSAGNKANHIHSVWRNMAGDFGVPVP